ncbi:hypothetical protein RSAG8_07143, partial [Rhizoctonia solani AG-8 WAC10335]
MRRLHCASTLAPQSSETNPPFAHLHSRLYESGPVMPMPLPQKFIFHSHAECLAILSYS